MFYYLFKSIRKTANIVLLICSIAEYLVLNNSWLKSTNHDSKSKLGFVCLWYHFRVINPYAFDKPDCTFHCWYEWCLIIWILIFLFNVFLMHRLYTCTWFGIYIHLIIHCDRGKCRWMIPWNHFYLCGPTIAGSQNFPDTWGSNLVVSKVD